MAAGIYGCKNDCGNVRLKNGRRKRTAEKWPAETHGCKNDRRKRTAEKWPAEMYGCKNDCGKRMVLMKGADEENI